MNDSERVAASVRADHEPQPRFRYSEMRLGVSVLCFYPDGTVRWRPQKEAKDQERRGARVLSGED